jgi:RNA polymerase sigma-70 factor (ECF subfamily)
VIRRNCVLPDVEVDWIRQSQAGNSYAFSQLVEIYQTPVYNLCYRMLGDAYEAEDAAQEAFLRAYKSIDSYDPGRSFSTWLLSIAAHHCIDQIRRRRMTIVPFEALPYEEVPDPAPNPESSVTTHEEQRRVQALLGALNPTDRAAMIMLYWYDYSYEEISDALDLSVSAVKSRLHRARKELAQTLRDQMSQNHVVEGKTHGKSAKSSAIRSLVIL